MRVQRVAETARRLDAPLATADPPLLETCKAGGIAVIALPYSEGAVWLVSFLAEEQHPGPAWNGRCDARAAVS